MNAIRLIFDVWLTHLGGDFLPASEISITRDVFPGEEDSLASNNTKSTTPKNDHSRRGQLCADRLPEK